MKVSALIPTYNRCEHVLRAIQSVITQTVPVDEIIVVDDGSTDGTSEEIRRRFGNGVRLICQANEGVSSARRRAMLDAKGDWIAFLDSDDEWTPDRNRIFHLAIAKAPPDVAWIFGNLQKVRDSGYGLTQYQEHGLQITEDLHVFEDPLSVQHPIQFGMLQSSVFKRESILELNGFAEKFKKGEDILLGYQVACRYRVAAIPDTVTKHYRTSDLLASSLSADQTISLDYYRALMKSYSLVACTGRRQPWGEMYAEAVRGACKEFIAAGESCRMFSIQQFRFGVSSKSVAFLCAMMLGPAGLRLWTKAGSLTRAALARFATPSATTPGLHQ
jgi:glycosyltransferase involved in cell wall biosynthesis